jgi:hypothetical protein
MIVAEVIGKKKKKSHGPSQETRGTNTKEKTGGCHDCYQEEVKSKGP